MKYAVYVDNPKSDSPDCNFYKTKEEALDAADAEKNLHWDITLLEVKGEVGWGPNGLRLVNK